MSRDELLFLAYRYLAGELSPDECAAFEGRLAVDQAARESLAQASQLAESVHLACEADVVSPAFAGSAADDRRAPTTRTRRGWFRRGWIARVGWMATGAAAVALVYFAIRPNGAPTSPHADPAAAALALVWAQQPSAIAEPADDEWPGEQSSGDDAAVAAGGADEPEVVHIPQWMLAAVSAAQGAKENVPLAPERID
ncbi:MAG: hypothetical protein HYS13_13155 [Planctomycetia bacterium]|nr:hypothetical protein [Planctomycetia bacterium]